MTSVDLTVLETADWTLDHSLLMQLQGIGEEYAGACPVYVVEHPEGTVLVDTGVSYEMRSDPANYGQFGAPHMVDLVETLEMDESQHLPTLLADGGFGVEEIDVVVQSHLHTDHAGNLDQFVGTEVVVHQAELRYAGWPDPAQQLFYLEGDLAPLRRPDANVRPISGPCDLFGDGSVVAFPTPGHTPGHLSLELDVAGVGPVILALDAAGTHEGYEAGLVGSFNWSLEESLDSVRRIRERATRSDAPVVVHHDQADQERLRDLL